MDNLSRLLSFLDRLDEGQIWYRLSKIRDAIMVEVAVPGQRWEIEFFADGRIEREVFESINDVDEVANVDALDDLVAPWVNLRKEAERRRGNHSP